MTPYVLTLLCLTLAVLAQFLAAALATVAALQRPYSRAFLVIAIGLGLLALQHVLTLELALRTGLFDLRQALLGAGVSLLLLGGVIGLKRRRMEMLPPR